jgi:uncharacterized repeat protein (TIGR03843 family)
MTRQQRVELDVERILELLTYGEIEVEGLLPYSSNYTLLTLVSHNGTRALAVYKPRRGERPLWDFPRGTLYQREIAAYLVSEALGFHLVPPTIGRQGPYGIGALQLFIENDEESHLLTMQREGCYENVLQRLAAFDCVVNNADRKSGHCLKGNDGRLWSIDHGICFHEEEKLRTVLWDFVGQPFPPDIVEALKCFRKRLSNPDPVIKMLIELLSKTELRALNQRLNQMINTGIYPYPGSGPHIPWPPV